VMLPAFALVTLDASPEGFTVACADMPGWVASTSARFRSRNVASVERKLRSRGSSTCMTITSFFL
jgi:hypothetical protein